MSARPRPVATVRKNYCLGVLGLAVALMASGGSADARIHRHHGFRAFHSFRVAHHHGGRHFARHGGFGQTLPRETPMFAAEVVDAGTGHVLYADHENDLRHPASLTKVMTLYLLFEKLKSGEMHLDDRISVSAHAASMAPTKLGLRPGATIPIDDAIKAIVTKSANDMAVAVAEAIGGDERTFAAMMTRRAHELGMSRTQYVNASGLPNAGQLTTAHDLTVLGRAIRAEFPQYYHFFSIPSFTYAGMTMPNHNHLLGKIEGMDGIKTGYTNASGFNLLTSVNRGGHHLVSVVLGGRTAASRDRIMAGLIEEHLEEAAPTRLADVPVPTPIEAPAETVARMDTEEEDAAPHELAAPTPRGPSLIAPTMAVPPVPEPRPIERPKLVNRIASDDDSPPERARPAFIAGTPRIEKAAYGAAERRHTALDGSTSARNGEQDDSEGAPATSTPSSLHWVVGPTGVKRTGAVPTPPSRGHSAENVDDSIATGSIQKEEPAAAEDNAETPAAHGGWVIQIGATDAADKANDLLSRARSAGHDALASAKPFTEKVQKGDSTLYRARFAGLEPQQAEAACRTLKRSGFACFATKD